MSVLDLCRVIAKGCGESHSIFSHHCLPLYVSFFSAATLWATLTPRLDNRADVEFYPFAVQDQHQVRFVDGCFMTYDQCINASSYVWQFLRYPIPSVLSEHLFLSSCAVHRTWARSPVGCNCFGYEMLDSVFKAIRLPSGVQPSLWHVRCVSPAVMVVFCETSPWSCHPNCT
eukprot:scaffold877_cov100-Skeletonema_dohrnii-CCMP3373.AAC.1